MSSAYRSTPVFAVGAVLAVLVVGPTRAADYDRYLPDDTEIVLTVNVRQILDSDLVKKRGLDKVKEVMRQNDELQGVLDSLGLDPLKDVDRLTLAGPGGTENERGLLIVQGRFDRAKFQAAAEAASRDHGDVLKIHADVTDTKGGKHTLYEVATPDMPQPVFIALTEKGPILASARKDYLLDALARGAGTEKPELKNKELAALLAKLDPKQSLTVAALGAALARTVPDDEGKSFKEVLDKLDAVSGGVTVGEDLKIELLLAAKNAAGATELGQAIKGALDKGKLAILALSAGGQKQKGLDTVQHILESIRTTSRDRLVIVKGLVSADIFDQADKEQ